MSIGFVVEKIRKMRVYVMQSIVFVCFFLCPRFDASMIHTHTDNTTFSISQSLEIQYEQNHLHRCSFQTYPTTKKKPRKTNGNHNSQENSRRIFQRIYFEFLDNQINGHLYWNRMQIYNYNLCKMKIIKTMEIILFFSFFFPRKRKKTICAF